MADDGIAPRLEQLGAHVKSLGAPWRAELRRDGSFRLLYADGKVSYWRSARRPLRAFLDMWQAEDVGAGRAWARLLPPYKNRPGIPLEVTDFDLFDEWAFRVAPERTLDTFQRDHWRTRENPIIKVWE